MAGSQDPDGADSAWADAVRGLFAAKAEPSLRRVHLPALGGLADRLLDNPSESDRDLSDLIEGAIYFANQLDSGAEGRERSALRSAAGAFLLAGAVPSARDLALIAKANNREVVNLRLDSKLVRSAWAYMVYKRQLGVSKLIGYHQKNFDRPRKEAPALLVSALVAALDDVPRFRALAAQGRREAIAARGTSYAGEREPDRDPRRVDRSEWVRDVTVPDGTRIPIGSRFIKTWEIRNAGNIPWVGRSLKRMTIQGGTLPFSAEFTPIPDTLPGESVQISVELTAARVQGSSQVLFKMVDRDGNLCFPQRYAHGVTLLIETVDYVWIDKHVERSPD